MKFKFLNKLFTFVLIFNLLITTAFASEMEPIPETTSTAHMLIDQNTGNVLIESNADMQIYPASTTKIMTALMALEHLNPNDMITLTDEAFTGMNAYSSTAGLKVGETISVRDLLYCLMLPSANEAANAIAYEIGEGDLALFAQMMNFRAVQLGAYDTNFVNASGLHDDNHYTTARDMSIITKTALKNELFCEIVNTAQKSIDPTNLTPDGRMVYTSNYLILRKADSRYYSYADGVKTGFTTPAGACLVSNAKKGSMQLISLIYGGERTSSTGYNSTFVDAKAQFEWGFNNHKGETLVSSLGLVTEVTVNLSAKTDYIGLYAKNELTGLVPIDYDVSNLQMIYHLPESIDAPIVKGQFIGTVDVSYDGVSYGSVELLAVSDVELSQVLYYVDKIENFFESDLFQMGFVVLTIIAIISMIDRKARRRKRVTRMRDKQRSRPTAAKKRPQNYKGKNRYR